MNKATVCVVTIVMFVILGGCTSTAPKPLDAVTGEIQIGTPSTGVMAPVQADIEHALKAWETGDQADAVDRLENILIQYASTDGGFERAILPTLALYYLELGRRDDFNRTVKRLRVYLKDRVRLSRETQYVLLVDQAMTGVGGQPISGRGVDTWLAGAVRDLLETRL